MINNNTKSHIVHEISCLLMKFVLQNCIVECKKCKMSTKYNNGTTKGCSKDRYNR